MQLKRNVGRWLRRAGLLSKRPAAPLPLTPLEKYLAGDRKPWSAGYIPYKREAIRQAAHDTALLDAFRANAPLPPGYGRGLDERIVEYPWMLTRLSPAPSRLLDAGGIVLFAGVDAWPIFDNKTLTIYTLAEEPVPLQRQNVSRLYGDLRATIFKDEVFDEIVCISTLEHIGLDNTRLYTSNDRFREASPRDYRLVLREFRRLLTPGGRLLLTVPYGRYHNHGWLQQFDQALVEDVLATFDGQCVEQVFYKYEPGGWRTATEAECRDAVYFDIHATPEVDPDFAAAARAVTCLVLARP